jgi:nitrate/TMAO reductase-like tetraheme cytochrome c subunit
MRTRESTAGQTGQARPSNWWVAAFVALGIVLGIVIAGTTTWMVNASSSSNFCATECHSMKWAAAAWEKSPHYRNPFGVRASCADCHIPFESRPATPFQYVFGTLWTKGLDGVQDVAAKLRGVIADEAEWNAEKPRLSAEVRAWFKQTHSATCQGCHKLDAFETTGPSAFMAMEVHAGLIKASTVYCLECHSGIAHVYPPASR